MLLVIGITAVNFATMFLLRLAWRECDASDLRADIDDAWPSFPQSPL